MKVYIILLAMIQIAIAGGLLASKSYTLAMLILITGMINLWKGL